MMRSGSDQERDGEGRGEREREADRPVLRRVRAGDVAGGDAPAHLRQQHGAGGDADHADGELIEPVGVIERRHRAGRQERGDDGVGEHRQLHAGRADDRGPERLEETLHRRIEARPLRGPARRRAGARRDPDEQEFEDARDRDAPGRRVPGGREQEGEREGAAMSETLSRTGAAAAAAKRSWALSMPERIVTSVTKRRYGKVMRVSVTARSNFAGSSEKPGASSVHDQRHADERQRASSASCTISISVKIRLAKERAAADAVRFAARARRSARRRC